jgi:hypothetical protein
VRTLRAAKTAAALALGLLMAGCTKQPSTLYNYGDYSQSYYAYKQDPDAKTLLAMQQAIQKAIADAGDSISKRVPPGMYANLGYIYLKQGNPKEAISNFELEKKLYPESAHFMDRMIEKVKMAEGAKS